MKKAIRISQNLCILDSILDEIEIHVNKNMFWYISKHLYVQSSLAKSNIDGVL